METGVLRITIGSEPRKFIEVAEYKSLSGETRRRDAKFNYFAALTYIWYIVFCSIPTHQPWWRRISGKGQMDTSPCHPLSCHQVSAVHLCRTIETDALIDPRVIWCRYRCGNLFSLCTVWDVFLNSHHETTLWIKGIGSTHIHPVVLHLMQYPYVVLALRL